MCVWVCVRAHVCVLTISVFVKNAIIGLQNKFKAASSDESAFASVPPPPPPGGFRKTEHGGQYAFKYINIGGLCQSFVFATLPATSWWQYDYN